MKRRGFIFTVLLFVVVLVSCNKSENGTGDNAGNNPDPSTGESKGQLLVTVKKVEYQPFDHYFLANGTVEAVEDAFISSEISGQIKSFHVKEGQRVVKGQLLISLNSDVTESALAEVKASLELARTVFERRKGLWEKKIGSEIQYLQDKTNKESLENRLKSLEAQLAMSKIKAPISGIVDEIYKKEGELAIPGVQLIQMVNLKKVYINADVSESYLKNLSKGDPVEVSFPSYPEMVLKTTIHRIGNVVKAQNRTFLVQLLLENEGEKMKPNMVAVVKMKDFSSQGAILVPAIIVKNDLKGSYVYIVEKDENGKTVARKIYITTGLSEDNNTMIHEGLKPGQLVIVKGYNLVKNGMVVKVDKGNVEG